MREDIPAIIQINTQLEFLLLCVFFDREDCEAIAP
jgi:hypothetical protein